MANNGNASAQVAARSAFAGAALFVALIVLFSVGGTGAGALLTLTVVAVAAHLVLFPVVAVVQAPGWSRAAGYGWLGLDVILNVAQLNGMSQDTTMALRLGGHVLAATWIALASLSGSGAARAAGVTLSLLLGLHAF